MKAMLSAFLAIAIIGVVAFYGLKEVGFSSSERQTGDAVRLD